MTRWILSALALTAIATSGQVSTANAQSANAMADQITSGLNVCERFIVDGSYESLQAATIAAGFEQSPSYFNWNRGDDWVSLRYREASPRSCSIDIRSDIPTEYIQAQARAWMQANRYQPIQPTVRTGLIAGRGAEQGAQIELEVTSFMRGRHSLELRQAGP